MNRLILATLVAAMPLPAAASEKPVFSCRSGAHTVIVVRSGGVLTYRSMRGGGLEIQVMQNEGVSRMGYSGGGELQAAFRQGSWTYVVYQRTVRTSFIGRNDARFEAGVDVVRNDRVVSRRRCGDPSSQFDDAGLAGLPEAWFVEH